LHSNSDQIEPHQHISQGQISDHHRHGHILIPVDEASPKDQNIPGYRKGGHHPSRVAEDWFAQQILEGADSISGRLAHPHPGRHGAVKEPIVDDVFEIPHRIDGRKVDVIISNAREIEERYVQRLH